MKFCNVYHPRRKHQTAQLTKKKELSHFQKWMNICLTPACIQYAANEAFTKDMPRFRKTEFSPGLFAIVLAEVAVFGGIGLTLWGTGKVLAKIIRQFQRPQYYPQERERRRRLAKERRCIRKRSTINSAPTGDEILAQWAKVHRNPQEMIRFGSMLCDIEAYVDNSLIRNEYGEIIGRRPGIRGWLANNCPQLHLKYKTIMRYKAMAEKFRQAFDLHDPYPATMLLDTGDQSENTVRNISKKKINENPITVLRYDEMVEMKARASKLFKESNGTERGLLAEIGKMVNPDSVSRDIEIRERLRQGLPEKDGVLRKFAKMMA